MHKLIQELVEQVEACYIPRYDMWQMDSETVQKFAELIVKEVTNIVLHYTNVDEGVAVAKKHFGVEPLQPKTQGIDLNDPSWRKILGLDRRVLTPAESAEFISRITGEDLAPLYSTNNQRSITEVYEIDGVKFHVNYLDEGEMIVEEML